MSTFTESIILTNAGDKFAARRGFIPESAIRTVTVNAWVDTGAWTLVINEEVRAKLGLELENTRVSTLADGTQVEYCMTEPVEFRWKDRWFVLPAQVIPQAKSILFGALPMEALDVIADPVAECLVGRHGDEPMHQIYGIA